MQRNIINATIMKTNLLFALLILGSLFGFAQKAPKGRLVSYSHSYGTEYSARWTSAVPPDEVTKARDVIRDFLESLVKRVTPTE